MSNWKDEKFNKKIEEIIRNKFFPDTEKIKVMSSLLDTEADEIWEVQKTAEQLLKTKKTKKIESLDEFLQNNKSEEQEVFEKINKNNKEKFQDNFWWVNISPSDNFKHISTTKNALMFQPKGLKDQGFKKPNDWIRSENTRLKKDLVSLNSYIMPEVSEKEQIALKLAERSMKGNRNQSRTNTPQTPSSRVSSIFPLYDYNLPSKRQREQTK